MVGMVDTGTWGRSSLGSVSPMHSRRIHGHPDLIFRLGWGAGVGGVESHGEADGGG